MSRLLLTFASALLLTISLAACDSGSNNDDNGDGNVQPGTFSASVTGDVTASLSGAATSTVFGSTWGITLAPGTTQTITMVASGTGRPQEGEYVLRRATQEGGPVLAGEFFGSLVLQGSNSYSIREGTLTVTSSAPTRVEGTFTFKADRFVGEEVEVEGAFNTTNFGG